MIQHSIRTHRRFAASAAYRWSECAGSVKLTDAVPEMPSSPWAIDGTEAHELLEYCFTNSLRSAEAGYVKAWSVRWQHRKDTRQSRIDSVQACLDYVWMIVDTYSPDVQVFLELSFPFPNTHNQDAGGTSDVSIYIPNLYILHVIDFKHGAGKQVAATGNTQTFMYGKGVKAQLEKEGKRIDTLVLTIIQPRVYNDAGPQTWVPTSNEEDSMWARLDDAIGAALSPTAALTVGPWCEWCPAAAARICPAIERKVAATILPVYKTLTDIEQVSLPTRQEMSPERIGQAMDVWPLVKKWFEDMENYAIELAMNGTPIPGKKVVFTQSRRKWVNTPTDTAGALSLLTGVPPKDLLRVEVINMTAADKLVWSAIKGVDKELANKIRQDYANLTIKETSGNFTLVDEADKRPAVSPTNVMFGKVNVPQLAAEPETEDENE